MKIKNLTQWQTRQLRKIFITCLNKVRKDEQGVFNLQEFGRMADLQILIKWHKTCWVGGFAYYNSRTMCIKMPRKDAPRGGYLPLQNAVASTFIHELGHCLGMRHNSHNTFEQYYSEWINQTFTPEAYSLEYYPERQELDLKINLRESRYQKALKFQERAGRKLENARKGLKKWTNKVKYYEKVLAVAKGKEESGEQTEKADR